MELTAAMPLRHEAFFYSADDEYSASLAPFLAGAVEADEAAMAVTTPHNADLLRQRLGDRADAVHWLDAADHYRCPPETIARYETLVREALGDGAERVRVVGEVQFGSSPAHHASWMRYESVLNDVFSTTPLWVVCPYDRRTLPSGVISAASRSHPFLRHSAGCGPSPDYAGPGSVLRDGRLLLEGRSAGRPVDDLPAATELRALRRRIHAEGLAAGLPPDKSDALVVAVNEVVTNALTHGAGPVDVGLWVHPTYVMCEVEEGGGLWDAPGAGYVPAAAPHEEGGRGLWLARCLTDDVVIIPGSNGTVVRLVQAAT